MTCGLRPPNSMSHSSNKQTIICQVVSKPNVNKSQSVNNKNSQIRINHRRWVTNLCIITFLFLFFSVLDLQQDASIQVWQFLLECLEDRRFRQIIRWTSTNTNANSNSNLSPTGGVSLSSRRRPANTTTDHSSFEFCILEPRELARFWAARKYGYYYQVGGAMASNTNTNNNNINYFQRFNRVLRYYLNKKRLLHKIVGKSNTYVFLINVQPFLNNLTNRSRTFA